MEYYDEIKNWILHAVSHGDFADEFFGMGTALRSGRPGMGPGAGPYAPRVIERVQEALRSQSLYSGEVNGLLDQATMEALGEFQKQHGLQVCGVPTPSTRRVLFQSSPTPPASQP
jgi:hypothetical protein